MGLETHVCCQVLDSPFCNLRQLAGELAQSVAWITSDERAPLRQWNDKGMPFESQHGS